MDYDYLSASDGTGDAPLMTIQSDRLTGGTVIDVDTVTHVSAKFIGTYGDLGPDGYITSASKRDFKGHTSGGNLVIDGFEAGSTDAGNVAGQVVVIKPTTGWSDRVATFIKNMTGRGTPETVTVAGINDLNANELVKFTATASAVNELTIANAATGGSPTISATGGDANASISLTPKGTGNVKKGANNIDWWEELGRTSLSSAGDTITLSGLTAKKYLKIIVRALPSGGQINVGFRFNNDAATNYSWRITANGGTDSTGASSNVILADSVSVSNQFVVAEVTNITSSEKSLYCRTIADNATGGAGVPDRWEGGGKWANTAAQITRVDVVNVSGAGDYAIGSEVIILGHD